MPTKLSCVCTCLLIWLFCPPANGEAEWPDTIRLAFEPAELSASQQHHPVVNTQQMLERLGFKVERYLCPWARCLKAARQGKVDFLDHLYKTAERESYLYFLSPPYTHQTGTFRYFAKPGENVLVSHFMDLHRYRIAVIRGNAYFPAFDQSDRITKMEATSESQMVQMVLRNRVDLFIAHPSLTNALVESLTGPQPLAEQPYKTVEIQGVYFAVPKASPWFAHRNRLEDKIIQALSL